ncbi:MAG: hypothetical protein QF888_04290 [Desulfobacterales bacterium]|nr:hypothetical protein [Desulfobacterales bacterium]
MGAKEIFFTGFVSFIMTGLGVIAGFVGILGIGFSFSIIVGTLGITALGTSRSGASFGIGNDTRLTFTTDGEIFLAGVGPGKNINTPKITMWQMADTVPLKNSERYSFSAPRRK